MMLKERGGSISAFFMHVRRNENREADRLATNALRRIATSIVEGRDTEGSLTQPSQSALQNEQIDALGGGVDEKRAHSEPETSTLSRTTQPKWLATIRGNVVTQEQSAETEGHLDEMVVERIDGWEPDEESSYSDSYCSDDYREFGCKSPAEDLDDESVPYESPPEPISSQPERLREARVVQSEFRRGSPGLTLKPINIQQLLDVMTTPDPRQRQDPQLADLMAALSSARTMQGRSHIPPRIQKVMHRYTQCYHTGALAWIKNDGTVCVFSSQNPEGKSGGAYHATPNRR